MRLFILTAAAFALTACAPMNSLPPAASNATQSATHRTAAELGLWPRQATCSAPMG
jgi:hypothetical protein